MQVLKHKQKKKYVTLMASLGNKKKNARITDDMYKKLKTGLKTHTAARSKNLQKESGYQFFDEDEYVQHWNMRKGWPKKKARREYKKAANLRLIRYPSCRLCVSQAAYVLTRIS